MVGGGGWWWVWVVVDGSVESQFSDRLWPRPSQTISHEVRWCQP